MTKKTTAPKKELRAFDQGVRNARKQIRNHGIAIPKAVPSGASRQLRARTTRDLVVAVLDRALTAAEGELKVLYAKRFKRELRPSEVAWAFRDFVNTHLEEEMANIQRHGHRNDDPEDKPETPTVTVSIEGGAGSLVSKPEGVRVEIRDYDIEGYYDDDELAALPKDGDGGHYAPQVFE